MDDKFKSWSLHTGKIVGVTAGGTALATLLHEIATAYFAANPLAQILIYGGGIALGMIIKSPYFKGAKE